MVQQQRRRRRAPAAAAGGSADAHRAQGRWQLGYFRRRLAAHLPDRGWHSCRWVELPPWTGPVGGVSGRREVGGWCLLPEVSRSCALISHQLFARGKQYGQARKGHLQLRPNSSPKRIVCRSHDDTVAIKLLQSQFKKLCGISAGKDSLPWWGWASLLCAEANQNYVCVSFEPHASNKARRGVKIMLACGHIQAQA